MNLPNPKLGVTTPKYYYRVQECGTRFIKDGIPPEPFHSVLDFKCDDLLESRAAAVYWYLNKLQSIDSASLCVILVEELGDKNIVEEYILHGKDEQTIAEGRAYELRVLKDNGFNMDQVYVSF